MSDFGGMMGVEVHMDGVFRNSVCERRCLLGCNDIEAYVMDVIHLFKIDTWFTGLDP